MNITYIRSIISIILRYISVLILIPCVCALIYKDYYSMIPFILSSALSFILGIVLKSKDTNGEELNKINKSEALCIVLISWLAICIFGMIPYIYFGLNPIDAIFESVSGITTTGATVLSDFSLYPKTMFFWRSFSQWLGGMGILVLFTVILPQFSVAGRQMFFAEFSGSKDNRLTPRIRQTAAVLWSIYFTLTLIEAGILLYLKMIDV